MSDEPRGGPAPARLPIRRFARIVNPKSEKGLSGWVSGEAIVWLITHFAEGQPRPCVGRGSCAHCKAGLNERGRGYASFVIHPSREHCLLEITEFAAEQLFALVDFRQSLRGLPIHLRRRSSKTNSAVLLSVHQVEFPGVLPRAFDPVRILRRFWRTDFRFSLVFPGGTLNQSADESMHFSGDYIEDQERQAGQ